ncbi:MAG: hypothetical protein J0H89_04245 [Rhizobiales bacterium]|nr:hypothetical protein [Hyphomicrobiales bacterium]
METFDRALAARGTKALRSDNFPNATAPRLGPLFWPPDGLESALDFRSFSIMARYFRSLMSKNLDLCGFFEACASLVSAVRERERRFLVMDRGSRNGRGEVCVQENFRV